MLEEWEWREINQNANIWQYPVPTIQVLLLFTTTPRCLDNSMTMKWIMSRNQHNHHLPHVWVCASTWRINDRNNNNRRFDINPSSSISLSREKNDLYELRLFLFTSDRIAIDRCCCYCKWKKRALRLKKSFISKLIKWWSYLCDIHGSKIEIRLDLSLLSSTLLRNNFSKEAHF